MFTPEGTNEKNGEWVLVKDCTRHVCVPSGEEGGTCVASACSKFTRISMQRTATRVNVPALAADQMVVVEGGRIVPDHGLVAHLNLIFMGSFLEVSHELLKVVWVATTDTLCYFVSLVSVCRVLQVLVGSHGTASMV
jgi:hypothetical protein